MSTQATAAAPAQQPLSAAPGACCDSGRPILTDPLTGQTVCSCQYDSQTQQILNYQRLASSFPLNVYGAPYGEQGYLPLTAEQSAFYSPTENIGGWPYPASMYYPYDPTLSGYPFSNGYGVDVNGARRKNATRETTSTLKAWLNEHRKNPYPTKGEKIMLAIITKMTLTQVSTWFANARRRLKKDNKVTWEPRNRVDDDDNDDAASDTNDRESGKGPLDKDVKTTNENGYGSSCHKSNPMSRGLLDGSNNHHHLLHHPLGGGGAGSGDDDDLCLGGSGSGGGGNGGRQSQRDSMSSPGSSIMSDSHSPLHSPVSPPVGGINQHHHNHHIHPGIMHMDGGVTPTGNGSETVGGGALKPRIWSIVDTATSHGNNHVAAAGAFGNSVGGTSAFMGGGGTGFGPGLYASANGGGNSAALKASQQLARNFRLGYASPYAKTVWRNGSFASVAPLASTTASSSSSLPICSSSPSSTTGAPPISCYSPPQSSPLLAPATSVSPTSSPAVTSPATTATSGSSSSTSGQTMDTGGSGSGSSALMLSPLMKSNIMAAAAAASAASSNAAGAACSAPSYQMTNASSAAAAGAGMNSMGSSLFSRTYAQTIHNLTNLTKGLNHLMTPPIGGAYVGSVKASPVQQDQRPEVQTSTS